MVKVRLPNLSLFPVVCFHYEPSKNPSKVTLQIPTDGFEDSHTYIINLDSATDMHYLIKRKNGLRLLDFIKMHGAVAYTNTGECIVMEVEDNGKTTPSRFNNAYAAAHRERQGIARRQAMRNWKIPALRRRKQKQPYLPS